ncbi:MAG TPA: hypothetical protein VF721_07650 [Pyrinomonadaceae bacterium]|jgi:hypothetical protein
MKKETKALLIAIGIYIALVITIIAVSYQQTVSQNHSWDAFIKLAGIWLTVLTGFTTAFVSMFVVYKQTKSAADLEKVRSDSAVNLEEVRKINTIDVGAILEQYKASLAVAVANEIETKKAALSHEVLLKIETLKSEFNRDLSALNSSLQLNLEFQKNRFNAERKAYDELYNAIFVYYHTLAPMETGSYSAENVKDAEKTMLAAGRYTISLPEKHKKLFLRAWQKAREIAETVNEVEINGHSERITSIWQQEVTEFGGLVNEFEAIAKKRHIELSITNETPKEIRDSPKGIIRRFFNNILNVCVSVFSV